MALFPELSFWLPMFYASSTQGEFFSFSEDDGVDNKLAYFNKEGRKYLPYLQSMMTGTRSEKMYQKLFSDFSKAASRGGS